MTDSIIKMCSYFLVIFLGYVLKRLNILKAESAEVISKVMLYITLPCVIINSFQRISFSMQFVSAIFAGFILNFLLLGLGSVIAKFSKDKNDKLLYSVITPSQNLGIFGASIAQAAFSSTVIAAIFLFDIGNAAIMFGPTSVIASRYAENGKKITIKYFFKKLFSSFVFDVYIVAVLLSVFKISLPNPVLIFTTVCASGNSFLAMLYFGLIFEPKFNRSQLRIIRNLLSVRYLFAIAASLFVWFVLPIAEDLKIAIMFSVAMPTATVSALNAAASGGDTTTISGISTMSIVISSIIAIILSVTLS